MWLFNTFRRIPRFFGVMIGSRYNLIVLGSQRSCDNGS
jgi:hypothetical protein